MSEVLLLVRIIKELGDARMSVLDLYYNQQDLNSETAKALRDIGKQLDGISQLAAFGPQEITTEGE